MGFKHFFAFALTLFAVLFLFCFWPASCNETVPKVRSDPTAANKPVSAYQVLRIKNTTPFFLNKPEEVLGKKRKIRKMVKRRKIYKNNFRSFSVMLPKGFVPPSGSSPCHNDKPDSSSADHVLFCRLSTNTAKP
ncbi:hypothetical protein PTKIN_Ptkin18bG0097900 [Pterospermum kingtungense]